MCDKHKNMLQKLQNHDLILQMQKYRQHGDTNTYVHCCNVACIAVKIAVFFRVKEYKICNIIIGAMLHDFYLYDYHGQRKRSNGWHAFVHPKIALQNAQLYFKLNKRQKNIIKSHMFPSTIWVLPLYAESWIVNISDKYCTIRELISYKIHKKQWEAKYE